MRRRDFLAAATASTLLSRFTWAADVPPDIKITRMVKYDVRLARPKYIGKNSFRGDHGAGSHDHVLRLFTNAGVEGFGTYWLGKKECIAFLGKSPLEFFDRDARKVNATLVENGTSAVWDLVGKVLKKPVYELLRDPSLPTGAAASAPSVVSGAREEATSQPAAKASHPNEVPAYDGSIYFVDLRPEHLNDWQDEFKRELDAGLAAGHRAFKIKVGRGKKWMPVEEGYQRDVEVVKLIRRHVGRQIVLAVDANNGYDLERTKRFVVDTADIKLEFIEQMFPLNLKKCLELKSFMKERGIAGLIADGEGASQPAEMRAWAEARVVDILQGDMNRFGFENIAAEAAMAHPFGVKIAPHNWGSFFGFFMQAQVGRAIPNFFRAEHDPLTCKAVAADEYRIRDGRCSVPDAPGLGLKLLDAALPDCSTVQFDLKA